MTDIMIKSWTGDLVTYREGMLTREPTGKLSDSVMLHCPFQSGDPVIDPAGQQGVIGEIVGRRCVVGYFSKDNDFEGEAAWDSKYLKHVNPALQTSPEYRP